MREVGIARSTLYNKLARGTVEQLEGDLKPYTDTLEIRGSVSTKIEGEIAIAP